MRRLGGAVNESGKSPQVQKEGGATSQPAFLLARENENL